VASAEHVYRVEAVLLTPPDLAERRVELAIAAR
jgi:hypothetical protein